MIKVSDIYKEIDNLAPFSAQLEWDNSGLLVGNMDNEVKKILVTLDITCDVAKEAIEKGCDMIISHHPIIFSPLKRLDDNEPVVMLAKNNISAICMHTCFDVADGGMNDILCRTLGFTPQLNTVLDDEENVGRIIKLQKDMSVLEVACLIKEKLGNKSVKFYDTKEVVDVIGICSGSASEFIFEAKEKGCDLFITGDVKHHDFINAKNIGLSIIDAGHYYTENIFFDTLKNYLNSRILELEIINSEKNIDIVEVI